MRDHWNKRYTDSPVAQLGWYESKPKTSLQLIENCAVLKHSTIMDVGSGTSTLIANLLDLGYQNLIGVDISDVALEKSKKQLDIEQGRNVRWIIDDITNPSTIHQLENIAVWHDRAVFHFLTEERARLTYRALAEKVVMPGGFIVIATFALEGASHCSGLPVERYSQEKLCCFFNGFKFLESLDYMYQMPSGDLRPFIYARFQKL